MAEERYSFHTIERAEGPLETTEKGSRFIAFIHPAANFGEMAERIKSLRKTYHDATHVCSACRILGERGEEFRSSDDGEPSGTAGIPILNELKRLDIFNAMGAVVRYFGGIKLGTGGLTRAYGGAMRRLLDSLEIREKPVMHICKLTIPFSLTGAVLPLLDRFGVQVQDRVFSVEGQELLLEVPLRHCETLENSLNEQTSGRLKFSYP